MSMHRKKSFTGKPKISKNRKKDGKRIGGFILAGLLLALCLSGCGSPKVALLDEPVIDYGETELITSEDVDAGIAIINETMDSWGIEYNLQKISYGGDEMEENALAYANSIVEGEEYDTCMILLADFVSLTNGSGYKKNELYENYEWLFVQNEGKWTLFNVGHFLLSD